MLKAMKYDEIKDRKPTDFQRLTGVKPAVFAHMLAAVQSHIRLFGRPCKLTLADQLLMTLMYWREYRTQFHIAQTYGVSEATVCRTIRKIEQALRASGQFRLPGKKAFLDPNLRFDVVVVDATESSIERPQKNKSGTTAARKSATPAKHKSLCSKAVAAY